jgi:hypothetical protein
MFNSIKTRITIVIALFFVAIIFLANEAKALTDFDDQVCRTTSTDGTIRVTDRTDLLQQTFTPTMDHLTRVMLYMNGDGVGTVSLWVVEDSQNGKFYINENGPLPVPNGDGGLTFSFGSVSLTPGKKYILLPVPSEDSTLYWFYKENCYANGDGYMGIVVKTYDYSFKTWGWNTASNVSPTPNIIDFNIISIPTATPLVKPTAGGNITGSPTATAMASGTGNATVAPTPILEIDSDIPAPTLEYVLKDSEKIENLAAITDLDESNKFVLYGTGVKDSKVVISIGNNNYEVAVDSFGTWFLQVPLSEIKSGTYVITGQTQINNKGGEILNLFTINLKNNSFKASVQDLSNKSSNNYLYIAAIIAVLIGLALLGLYLSEKKKKLIKLEKEKTVVNDSATAIKGSDIKQDAKIVDNNETKSSVQISEPLVPKSEEKEIK